MQRCVKSRQSQVAFARGSAAESSPLIHRYHNILILCISCMVLFFFFVPGSMWFATAWLSYLKRTLSCKAQYKSCMGHHAQSTNAHSYSSPESRNQGNEKRAERSGKTAFQSLLEKGLAKLDDERAKRRSEQSAAQRDKRNLERRSWRTDEIQRAASRSESGDLCLTSGLPCQI